jgi:hypothetical protein
VRKLGIYLTWKSFLGVSVLMAVTPPSGGQEVFVPLLPPPTPPEESTRFFKTNGLAGGAILAAVAPPSTVGINPLQIGPFSPRFHLDYQFINATGIRQATGTVSTIQHSINPGVIMQLSRLWKMEAGAALDYFSDQALNDTVGFNVGLRGAITRDEWIYGLTADVAATEGTQIETARQTKQNTYAAGLLAVRALRPRTSLELGLNQAITISSDLNNLFTWSTLNWLNYLLGAKTTVGVGAGGGYNMLNPGSDSTSSTGTDSAFEQIQGRILWRPAERVSVNANGGLQIQHFLGEEGGDTAVNPTFLLSAGWSPFAGTTLSLSGGRTVGNSITTDSYTLNTAVAFGISQTLYRTFTLSVGPSYGQTDYKSNTDPSAEANRSDETLAFNASLSVLLFKKLSMAAFFQYSDHDSNDPFFTYESRQVGFQVGYRF